LLGLNRSTLYYKEKPADIDDIDLLNAIRDAWERYPFYGYRRITKELRAKGILVNRKRVQRIMVWGGIQAIHPGPNTSKRNKQHAVYKYLLRDLSITHANQAWMVDITYLRMPDGFMYLVALIDVHSRYVVGWSLSNTLETGFCIDALKSGLLHAKPEIINSDQGCQFTSEEWINFLRDQGIKVSMTGVGRCHDNIYIERFWRSLKREEFYLNEYLNVGELKKAIKAYIEFYNQRRWHQSLGYKTPAEVYFGGNINQ
jgi:putative transposase